MGQLPHSQIPMKFQEDEQTAGFMEDVRRIVAALNILGDGIGWYTGNGSPEGVVPARVGSLYSRLNGPPVLYVKESGTGSSGWVSK